MLHVAGKVVGNLTTYFLYKLLLKINAATYKKLKKCQSEARTAIFVDVSAHKNKNLV